MEKKVKRFKMFFASVTCEVVFKTELRARVVPRLRSLSPDSVMSSTLSKFNGIVSTSY